MGILSFFGNFKRGFDRWNSPYFADSVKPGENNSLIPDDMDDEKFDVTVSPSVKKYIARLFRANPHEYPLFVANIFVDPKTHVLSIQPISSATGHMYEIRAKAGGGEGWLIETGLSNPGTDGLDKRKFDAVYDEAFDRRVKSTKRLKGARVAMRFINAADTRPSGY